MGMKEIGKFSTDSFILSVANRRQFIMSLLAVFSFSDALIARSKILPVNDHFYFADLRQGAIFLPQDSIIDSGQPGSLMKLIAAIAILEENLPAATQIVDCRGAIRIGGQRYVCRYPHGQVSLTEAIGQSCNVFFAHSSQSLTRQCFLHYLKKLEPSLGTHNLNRLRPGRNSIDLILGTADGFILSAIEILQMVSLIALQGKLLPLYFDNDAGHKIICPQLRFSEHTWNVLQTGMQIACLRGTAKMLDPQNKLRLAVKTGTTNYGKTFQSWLAGYFPYDAPRYAFCLRAKVGTSYDRAVPLAKKHLFSRNWAVDRRTSE